MSDLFMFELCLDKKNSNYLIHFRTYGILHQRNQICQRSQDL